MTAKAKNELIIKHSIVLNGMKTSTSLEEGFWNEVVRMAKDAERGINEFINDIDAKRPITCSLSCALRLAVLNNLKAKLAELAPTQQAAE